MLVWNILLALIWAAVNGDFSPRVLMGGFLLGYGLLWILSRRGVLESGGYVERVPRVLGLLAFFLYELVLANVRLAAEAVRPRLRLRPAVVAMPLDLETDGAITLLAALITLTPGTLSIEVSNDRKYLYVHVMDSGDGDLDAIKANLKNGFERRVREVLR